MVAFTIFLQESIFYACEPSVASRQKRLFFLYLDVGKLTRYTYDSQQE